ncbi:hypothetical protein N0B51_12375 [Tsuneonella sp. YG55]|uniref:Uncharacterized protein n=1 Tax=Tsuneonella litorea TaxID=2976475 RepID=A0A9X3ALH8_9SPHN|nr:hypothetical protein [Tsuneonella litorea]MCT2559774.1 hypothetical protein [Tsuneonella litorea]
MSGTVRDTATVGRTGIGITGRPAEVIAGSTTTGAATITVGGAITTPRLGFAIMTGAPPPIAIATETSVRTRMANGVTVAADRR